MKRWHWLIVAVILILSVVTELFFVHHHAAHHWWSGIPLFFSLFGFAGSLGLIFLCKFVLIHFIAKREDYYDAL